MKESRVAIFSYRREDRIQTATLRFLCQKKWDPRRTDIVVANEVEAATYRREIPKDRYDRIIVAELGKVNALWRYHEDFPAGAEFVCFDDDVTELHQRVEAKLRKVERLEPILDRGFDTARKVGARLWGVENLVNANWTTEGVDFCGNVTGSFCGIIVDHDQRRRVFMEELEDIRRSLQYRALDGAIVLFRDLCVSHDEFSPGGMGYGVERWKKKVWFMAQTKKDFPGQVDLLPGSKEKEPLRIKITDHPKNKETPEVLVRRASEWLEREARRERAR